MIGVVLGHSTRSKWYVNIGDTSTKEILQGKSTNFSKCKGKIVLKSAQEESRWPQTMKRLAKEQLLIKMMKQIIVY